MARTSSVLSESLFLPFATPQCREAGPAGIVTQQMNPSMVRPISRHTLLFSLNETKRSSKCDPPSLCPHLLMLSLTLPHRVCHTGLLAVLGTHHACPRLIPFARAVSAALMLCPCYRHLADVHAHMTPYERGLPGATLSQSPGLPGPPSALVFSTVSMALGAFWYDLLITRLSSPCGIPMRTGTWSSRTAPGASSRCVQ